MTKVIDSKGQVWDKAKVQSLLMTSDLAVETALLRLYNRQTLDEQQSKSVNRENGMGFTGADAFFLSSLAEWVLKQEKLCPTSQDLGLRTRLSRKQRERARLLLMKYWRQLLEEIVERRQEIEEREGS